MESYRIKLEPTRHFRTPRLSDGRTPGRWTRWRPTSGSSTRRTSREHCSRGPRWDRFETLSSSYLLRELKVSDCPSWGDLSATHEDLDVQNLVGVWINIVDPVSGVCPLRCFSLDHRHCRGGKDYRSALHRLRCTPRGSRSSQTCCYCPSSQSRTVERM